MLKAYIPIDKRQGKAHIRGLWHSDRQGLCYDYLRKASIEAEQLPFIKRHYKQEAIFYTDKGKAGLKDFIKSLIKTFGGVTIYIKEAQYLFEVWTK